MLKKKRIIKSRPTTERLLQDRAKRFKRDMENALRGSSPDGYEWHEYSPVDAK